MATAAFPPPPPPPPPSSPSLRLREALEACSKYPYSSDVSESVAAVIDALGLIVEPPPQQHESVDATEEALEEVRRYLSSPSSNQMALDELSLELPRVVVKFAAISEQCRRLVENVLELCVSLCSPRDMIVILCEVSDNQIRETKSPTLLTPLLACISKVLLHLQRRHVEQVRMALPVILKVLTVLSPDGDEEDKDRHDLFTAAISIGTSIHAICEKMVGERKAELCAILGLYSLQNIALISRSRWGNVASRSDSTIIQLSRFLPFCGMSFSGLITGSDVSSAIDEVSKGDGDDLLPCFSFAIHGAALAVIWANINEEVAKAVGEDLTFVLDRLRNNPADRWQALGVLQTILSSMAYPWEIKSQSINFLLCIFNRNDPEESNVIDVELSPYIPSLLSILQAIQRIIISTSNASLRKSSFVALKKVISDLPASYRFDVLKALITNSNSSSMTAILIDLVRAEIVAEGRQRSSSESNNELEMVSPFWSSHALDLVEFIMKPPQGGPPSLPEDSDSVLSALNLFRFILIMESSGKTNHTGILSEKTLRKAYSDWLLPLRTLISGIKAENVKNDVDLSDHILCAINPLELVLYRSIELVEEILKRNK